MADTGEQRRITVRLSKSAEDAVTKIKELYGVSDAEAIRRALATELKVAEALAKDERIWITDKDRQNPRELVFVDRG